MPLNTIPLPFGLRDVAVGSLSGETPGSAVDLPNSQTLTFTETEDSVELRGDDTTVAVHGLGLSCNWTAEAGGISFEALAVMNGGTVTTTGTTPNQIKTYAKLSTDARPYFTSTGKAISDSGGDFWVRMYRMKVTGDVTGTLADGTFWVTSLGGRALGRVSDNKLYDLIQHETATALVLT